MVTTSSYVGRVIAERFEVSCALGEGACGTVWVARDRVLGIPVALKLLRSTLRLRPSRRAAFEREARLCQRMLSPHVVRTLAFGIDEGEVPYIAYELLHGASLMDRLLAGPTAIDELEAVITQLARGLTRAHALGVVHRDIKPSNVFLTLDDRDRLLVKLLDFGIARLAALRPADDEGTYGTVEYMAPEVVLQEGEAGEAADIYALTAVAYECLTGAPPFAVSTLHDVVVRIALGPREPPSVAALVGEAVAAPLDAWFRKGLALDPRARFRTPNELADALHEATSGARASRPRISVCTAARATTTKDAHARLAAGESLHGLRNAPPKLEDP